MVMTGWQWFWTLVGFLLLILALTFLYFFPPFEALVNIVLNGFTFQNSVFWVTVIIGLLGFCAFHWSAYKTYIRGQGSVEAMVLTSLRGATFTAVLLSAGAALQAVQNACVYLLQTGYTFDGGFGKQVGTIIALVVITGVFCIIFWLLKLIRPVKA